MKNVTIFKFSKGEKYADIIGETPKKYIVRLRTGEIVMRKKRIGYKQRDIMAASKRKRTFFRMIHLHIILFFRKITNIIQNRRTEKMQQTT